MALCLTVVSLLCLSFYVSNFTHNIRESVINELSVTRTVNNLVTNVTLTSKPVVRKTDRKALVFAESLDSKQVRDILIALESSRFRYKLEYLGKTMPNLTNKSRGKYSLIIFQRFESYLNMDYWNRGLLDKYCRTYHVGILSFTHPTKQLLHAQARGFPLYIRTQQKLVNYEIDPLSEILNMTKGGTVIENVPGM